MTLQTPLTVLYFPFPDLLVACHFRGDAHDYFRNDIIRGVDVCASAVFHLPLIHVSQLWSVEERGILVPLWLCCLTPYVTLARTYYFADLTPWNAKRHIYQLAIIYSSPTVPRPRHIAFSHLDLSVSQKNRTPSFFRNYYTTYGTNQSLHILSAQCSHHTHT